MWTEVLDAERFTRPEEAALALSMNDGDATSRTRLILSCVPIAIHTAAQLCECITNFAKRRQKLDEAISDAMAGLVGAVDVFDPKRGRLTTLVVLRVRQSVTNNWRRYQGAVYVPQSATNPNHHRSEGMVKCAAVFMETTTIDSVPDDCFSDGGENRPDTLLETQVECKRAMAALSILDLRRRRVLDLNVMSGMSLQDISVEMVLTKQRVRQLKQTAIEQLRQTLSWSEVR